MSLDNIIKILTAISLTIGIIGGSLLIRKEWAPEPAAPPQAEQAPAPPISKPAETSALPERKKKIPEPPPKPVWKEWDDAIVKFFTGEPQTPKPQIDPYYRD